MSQETTRGITSGIAESRLFYPWVAIIALGLIIGVYGAAMLLLEGSATLGIHEQMPWGLLIAVYVFLALLSTGICIGITALSTVFGMEKYDPLVKRAVMLSIVTLVGGGLVIVLSIGQTFRLHQLLLSPNPGSPMWWMIVFYGIYMVALVAEFYTIERKGTSVRTIGVLALLAPIAAGSTLGAIFGFADVRPYYGEFFGPAYLLTTAILSGIALIAAVTIVEYKASGKQMGAELHSLLTDTLGKYLGLMLAVTMFFLAWRHILGLSSTNEAMAQAHQYFLFGPPSWWYWTVGIVIGLVIPFFLVLNPGTRSLNGVLAASIMVLVGMFASRLEFVTGGQVVALTQDPSLQYPLVSYSMTGVEIAVAVFGLAVAAFLYTAASKLFDLNQVPTHGPAPTQETPDEAIAEAGGETDD